MVAFLDVVVVAVVVVAVEMTNGKLLTAIIGSGICLTLFSIGIFRYRQPLVILVLFVCLFATSTKSEEE